MSTTNGSSISIFTTSDDTDDRPARRRNSRAERRRERYATHRALRGFEQTPIRKLLRAGA
jgi:hypothetical protein